MKPKTFYVLTIDGEVSGGYNSMTALLRNVNSYNPPMKVRSERQLAGLDMSATKVRIFE